MKWIPRLLARPRLVLTVCLLWVASGVFAWQLMPRQEDPTMPNYWGLIVAPFPGSDTETVERLVLEPIEEALAEIAEIRSVTATARADAALFEVELKGNVDDLDGVWDEIRRELEEIQSELPKEALPPTLNSELNHTESVILAVSGTDDRLFLADVAQKMKRALLKLPEVKEIRVIADPGEQITIAFDDATAKRLGIDASWLAKQLSDRNQLIPGGAVQLGTRAVTLRPGSEFASLEEIRQTPVLLPSGASVPLSTVTNITQTPREPATERMWHNGEIAMGLSVVPQKDINVVGLGKAVNKEVDRLQTRFSPLQIETVIHQPSYVAKRIDQLTTSLLISIAVVAVLLFAAMGIRLGAVVSAIVPMVVLAGLGLFGAMGGSLHQISIAALVIALGMLVDNAIVITESIQVKLDNGMDKRQAAQKTVQELMWPLGAATGTTVAAFLPMLMAEGATAEFTSSIPVIIMLTLGASYLFALLVTPILARTFLKPRTRKDKQAPSLFTRAAGGIGAFAVTHVRSILMLTVAIVLLSVGGIAFVSQQFFPSSDRNMVVIDVNLPEGAHINPTSQAIASLVEALQKRNDVISTMSFAGRSVPHFYYNLPQIPNTPQSGQIVVETRSVADNTAIKQWIRQEGNRIVPEADLLARSLEQGPPVVAPIEIRLFGEEMKDLETATEKVVREVKAISSTADVRHNLGVGTPLVRFQVDDAAAARQRLNRSDIALAMLRTSRGMPVGHFRYGEDPIPIFIRSEKGDQTPLDTLAAVDVASPGNLPVPLAQVALPSITWRPAAIRHRDHERMTTVTAQLAEGATFSDVLKTLRPKLEALNLNAMGVEAEIGGDSEGSGEANAAMMATLPFGLLLLMTLLLAEFNSFRKLGIIFMTVPLAAAGVIPGLIIADQPFGFMSLLGVFALVGIVVNNAIVLIDLVDRRRKEGAKTVDAVKDAVKRRARPILLTTMTTIAGLIPLALSQTTLWPPLAWAMISGLAVSTLLTLFVVPALYTVLFKDKESHAIQASRFPSDNFLKR